MNKTEFSTCLTQRCGRPARYFTRLFLTVWITIAGLLLVGVGVKAQQRGTLHLPELPAQAHVYVDDKPVAVKNGTVTLSTGWHRVQVEAHLPRIGLAAYRRPVQIMAKRATEIRLVWHQVRVDINEHGKSAYSPPGYPGPTGAVGPPAHPYQPLPTPADTMTLLPLLREVRDILLNDLTAQVQDTVNGINGETPLVYLYSSQPPLVSGEPGSVGEIGPVGPPGIPAEASLIQAQANAPMRDVVAQCLGLPDFQRTLTALQQRIQTLSQARQNRPYIAPEPLRLLTPAWKAEYDRDWKRMKAEASKHENYHGEIGDILGPPGASGRRGPDGIPPPGAMPLYLSPSDEKALLKELTGDKPIQEKIQQVRRLLAQLEERVYLAEGEKWERAQRWKSSTSNK